MIVQYLNWIKGNRQLISATSVLIGAMVGVGLFGLPLAFSRAGFVVGVAFLFFVGGLVLLVDLMYAEIILRTKEDHQLVGYAEMYAGKGLRRALFFSAALNGYAGLLAYMLISGQFLSNIFSFFFYQSIDFYSILFVVVFLAILLMGIKRISFLEIAFSILFLGIVIIILGFSIPKIDLGHLIDFSSTSRYWFLPYGVLLFAFGGLSAIPIQRQILKGQEKKLFKAILIAMIFVAVLFLLFVIGVVGVTGGSAGDDSIADLFIILGDKMMVLCSLFGILAIGSCFLMLGSAFQEIFTLDFGFNRFWSWLLVVAPPIVLYFLGLRDFVSVIGLGGAVALGFEAIVIIYIYLKAKKKGNRVPESRLSMPHWILYGMMLLFALGAILKLFLDVG